MKTLLRFIVAAAALHAGAVLAQYPTKPIALVAAFAAGGDSDLSAAISRSTRRNTSA